jgi:hypothetical protein
MGIGNEAGGNRLELLLRENRRKALERGVKGKWKICRKLNYK